MQMSFFDNSHYNVRQNCRTVNMLNDAVDFVRCTFLQMNRRETAGPQIICKLCVRIENFCGATGGNCPRRRQEGCMQVGESGIEERAKFTRNKIQYVSVVLCSCFWYNSSG